MTFSGWSQRLQGGGVLGHVVTLAGATGLAQALTVAISPILSRLYSPSDYGVLAVVSSTSGLLTFLATLRYELAVPLPAVTAEARRLATLAASLGIGFSVLLAGACWRWGEAFFEWARTPQAGAFWWAVPLAVLGQAAYQVGYHWALRTKAYPVLAATRVWQSLSSAGVYLLLGWLTAGPVGLLLGFICAQAAGVLRLFRHFKRTAYREADHGEQGAKGQFAATARAYGRFAAFGSLAGFLNASGTLLPPLLVATLYGEAAAGAMGFAMRLISLPMQLIGMAVGQVFLAEAATMLRETPEAVPALFFRLSRRMSGFALVILLGGLLSPWAFPQVFGAEWREAGYAAAWLCAAAAAQIVVSPVSSIAVLMKRQGVQLALDALRAGVVVLALGLPWWLGAGFLPAVAAFSLAMLLVHALSFAAYMTLARRLQEERKVTQGEAL